MAERPFSSLAAFLCLTIFPDLLHAAPAFSPCTLTGEQGYGRVEAQCARLARPENPDDPGGRQIELFVARVESLSPEPREDAFTIINGGPGASSVSLYVDLSQAFAGVLRDRDIIIVDQRGTGRSSPLECRALEEASQEYSAEVIRRATRQCLDSLSADPRYYSTSQAVADLEAVRESLGYRALNIYGVSYGTRVAMHYLRRHPERVRTLVIDGVVPPGLALGVNVAENAQATLNGIFQRCHDDALCAGSFPNLKRTFGELRDELRAAPVPLTVAHPITGAENALELGYDQLAVTVRLLSYAPETAALIPLIIAETSRGNYVPVASQALKIVEQLTGAISFGMHNSVVCTEDLPFANEHDIDWSRLEQTYLGADQVRALQTICEIWPRARMDADLRDPLRSQVPALVLSGEYDPITPPAYGARVSAMLGNALHVVGRGQGHGIIARGCIPGLVARFVAEGKLDDLDLSCTARLSATPFFLNLLGPAP